MANIFELSSIYKQIIEMADQLDAQTLDDMLGSVEESTKLKVASTIAVVKSIKGELEVAEEFKKTLDNKIKIMNNTVERLNDYILLGVNEVGAPKEGAEQFRKLGFKDIPWVKSAWTQYSPPFVEIVDDRLVDTEFKDPQPDILNKKEIAKRWRENTEEYEAKRSAYVLELDEKVSEGEIVLEDAEQMLEEFEQENRNEMPGVNVTQSIAVHYR